jgi:hypothetical protein
LLRQSAPFRMKNDTLVPDCHTANSEQEISQGNHWRMH